MNIENLNQAIIQIAEKKAKISGVKVGTKRREKLNLELEALIQSFLKNHGPFVEEVLFNIYDEYCPDDEVQPPSVYIAGKYRVVQKNSGIQFEVEDGEGILVDVDDFPGIKAKLVLVPNPTRIILQGDSESFKEVLWSA